MNKLNWFKKRKLRKIAKVFGIKHLVFVKPNDCYCRANGIENYINCSYIIGCDAILLGMYDDPELQLISFFHELGHLMFDDSWPSDQYEIERLAWVYGIKIAQLAGYKFSNKAIIWGFKQAETYKNLK